MKTTSDYDLYILLEEIDEDVCEVEKKFLGRILDEYYPYDDWGREGTIKFTPEDREQVIKYLKGRYRGEGVFGELS